MNQDTPMSDASVSASQTAEEKRPDGNWNTKKWREDFDMYRSRLVDQNFKASTYPDPLLPRKDPSMVYNFSFPDGAREELKALIAKIEGTA